MILAAFDNFWRMSPSISASDFSGKTDLTTPKERKGGKERRTDTLQIDTLTLSTNRYIYIHTDITDTMTNY